MMDASAAGLTDTRLVTLDNVSIAHTSTPAVWEVGFHVDRGEIVTLLGRNGSGKSTLLRAIIGALTPQVGTITHAPDLKIGYVPQKLAIDPTLPLSVARFLNLPTRHPRDKIEAALSEAGLAEAGKSALATLSGGQLQRVMLARALLADPDLLILDEPTQGLDHQGCAKFYRQIEDVRDRLGCGVLMVNHDLHVVMSASDRVICLNGHVCCSGRPQTVASEPAYQALFGVQSEGMFALYRHDHDHSHDHSHDHDHSHGHDHPHSDGDAKAPTALSDPGR